MQHFPTTLYRENQVYSAIYSANRDKIRSSPCHDACHLHAGTEVRHLRHRRQRRSFRLVAATSLALATSSLALAATTLALAAASLATVAASLALAVASLALAAAVLLRLSFALGLHARLGDRVCRLLRDGGTDAESHDLKTKGDEKVLVR